MLRRLAIFVFLYAPFLFGQASRFDWNVQTINSATPSSGASYPVLAYPNAGVALCNAPANGVPCTNYANTFATSAGSPACPSNAQLTRPGSAICVNKADQRGGFGAWLTPGNYQYTVTTAQGSFGPFDFTAAGTGTGTGSVSGQASGVIPLGTGATAITSQSHLNDGVTTPGKITSTEPIVAPSLSATGLSSGNCVQIGAGGILTTTGAPCGGTTAAPPAFALQLANSGVTGLDADANILANTTNHTLQSASFIGSGQPLLDIRATTFAGGAKCDGSTDDTAALQAAIVATPSVGGNILIPSYPNICYFKTNGGLNWGSGRTGPINLFISGTLQGGTSWYFPPRVMVNLFGQGGGANASFQHPGTWARVGVLPVTGTGTGTLGTDVTVTTGTISAGTKTLTLADPTGYAIGDAISLAYAGPGGFPLNTTITNLVGNVATVADTAAYSMTTVNTGNIVGHTVTFTPSNMSGITQNAALNVTGTVSCTLTTLTRASNKVTATYTGTCHIPAQTYLTVAGVTDSSFNGSNPTGAGSFPKPFMVNSNDYVTNTITWWQTGANASSTGGTATSMNEDSVDHVLVTASTATTATATFWRSHSASDAWGLVTVYADGESTPINIENVTIVTYAGTGLWLRSPNSELKNVGISTAGSCGGPYTNVPMEYETSFSHITGSSFTSCGMPWSLRISNPFNSPNGIAGPLYIDHSTIMMGIKMDHGGPVFYGDSLIFDQAGAGAIVFDPTNYWTSSPPVFSISNSGYNDNGNQFNTAYLYYTQPTTSTLTRGAFSLVQPTSNGVLVNDYYSGNMQSGGPGSYGINTARGILGTYNDGRLSETELRGSQASMAPAVIPYATLPVTTNPASWPTSTCAVATGALAPDGTATAGQLTKASSSGESFVLTYTFTPSVGDTFLFGGWVYDSQLGKFDGAGGAAFIADNVGSGNYTFTTGQQATSSNYDARITDDWWHPVVAIATVGTANGVSSSFRLGLTCEAGYTQNYWQPFAIYIPASANIPLREINRWRSQLLHGWVPSNVAATGASTGLYSGYPIMLPSDPTAPLQAATKHYVDTHAGGGSVGLVAFGDQTGLTANLGTTTLYTAPSNQTYRLACYLVVTTAAGTSATVPTCWASWTDADTGLPAKGFSTSTLIAVGTAPSNTVSGTNLAAGSNNAGNQVLIHVKSGTNITYSTSGYVSSPAAALTYNLHLTLELVRDN